MAILPDDAADVNRLLDICERDPAFLKRVNAELGRAGKIRVSMFRVIREGVAQETMISMDQPRITGDPGSGTFGDTIPIDDLPIEVQITVKDMKERMLAALKDTLTPRAALVLIARFGLDDHGPRTLEEVGRMLGVTRERIRQMETKALWKVQEAHPELVTLLDYVPIPRTRLKCIGCGGQRDVPSRSRCKSCRAKQQAAYKERDAARNKSGFTPMRVPVTA